MADITSNYLFGGRAQRSKSGGKSLTNGGKPATERSAHSQDLVACVELLFFAYRDFTGDPDSVLEQYNFGRAHHRVLHFVHRYPGLRVANLLDILKITKQSLSRVLKQLIDEGFILQKAGDEDRRERLLFVTSKGAKLADKLTALQVKRIEAALAAAGPGADAATRKFLLAMIAPADRPRVEALIDAWPEREPRGAEGEGK
jgi:DNA-binding MarR family transcriptional regulator